MRKIFYNIHLWLSIPLGIIITIICLSGAILVFQNEINETVHHDRYFADVMTTKPIPLNKLIPMVNKQLSNNNKVISVDISSDPTKNYVMGLPNGFMSSAYVNPYTGKLVDVVPFDFFSIVMLIHATLFTGFAGRAIVGYITFFFIFILISGIILWWPRNRKSLKTQLSIHIKQGWRRFWTDLHIRGGIYICIGLLILSLTGLAFAFEWYRKGLFSLLGAKIREKDTESRFWQTKSENINYAHWPVAVNTAKQKYSDFNSVRVMDGIVLVKPKYIFGNIRHVDMYMFNSNTGKIVKSIPYKDQNKSDKISGWILSLHTGTWGGMLSKILTFIIAIFGACLPITGYYMYFMKRAHRKKK